MHRTVFAGPLVIRGRQVLDGSVVVEDGVVVAVRPDPDVAPEIAAATDERVDARGMTLLPGLIDAHVHLHGPDDLRQAIRYGVTTEIDMFSCPPPLTAGLRELGRSAPDAAACLSAGVPASAQGGVPGAGLPPMPGGWALPGLRGPAEADAFVAARVADGADFLTIVLDDQSVDPGRPVLGPETVAALVGAAHRRGVRTVAHAPSLRAFRTALSAGVEIITQLPLDGLLDRSEVEYAVANRVVLIPTLTRMHALADPTSTRRLLADARLLRGLAPGVADALATGARGGQPVAGRRGYPTAVANLRMFLDAEATVLAGTAADERPGRPAAVLHGASMHLELELLVEAGMTPPAALEAATSTPARVFGMPDRRRVTESQRADLLLVDGDPTIDITATRNVVGVWKAGVRVAL